VIAGLATRAALATALLTGFGPEPETSLVPVRIENDTDVSVGLYVGDEWLGTFPAGSSVEVTLPSASSLRLPTMLELLAPSGAVRLSVALAEDQLAGAATGGYGTSQSVDVACGVVTLVVGRLVVGQTPEPPSTDDPVPCE
jgi:hypothetical protein